MGAGFAILAAASAVDRIDDMTTLARALDVDTPLLVLLTSSACADCRFLAMGFGEAASLARDRPAAKAWRRKSSVRSDIVVITDKVVQGADDVVIGDPDQPNRVRPTEKS